MSGKTGIEWTDATWNPATGCTKISRGCANCYFIAQHDMRHSAWANGRWPGAPEQYRRPATAIQLFWQRLSAPLHWRQPRRVFVNSTSDLFHEEIPDDFLRVVFGVMAASPRHTFQILTKRPARMAKFFANNTIGDCYTECQHLMVATPIKERNEIAAALRAADKTGRLVKDWPVPNVWLGVSCEDQSAADARVPLLIEVPAKVHFLSCEPLLGPVMLRPEWVEAEIQAFGGNGVKLFPRVEWVICGGESGKNARPMKPEWALSLRDQCVSAHIPFFFKQWGEWFPGYSDDGFFFDDRHGEPEIGARRFSVHEFPPEADGTYQEMGRIGKKAAGRVLDGREWSEFPS